MKKLKYTIVGVMMIFPLISFAGDLPWLTFKLTDNTETSVAADNLNIEYVDGNLCLKSATVDQSIPVARILSMRFTSSASGVESVVSDGVEYFDFYTLSGVNVGRFTSADAARRNLPSGVYVVKSKTKDYKVIF